MGMLQCYPSVLEIAEKYDGINWVYCDEEIRQRLWCCPSLVLLADVSSAD